MATKEQLEIERRYNRLLEEQKEKKAELTKMHMDTSAVDKQIKSYENLQKSVEALSGQIDKLGNATGMFGKCI